MNQPGPPARPRAATPAPVAGRRSRGRRPLYAGLVPPLDGRPKPGQQPAERPARRPAGQAGTGRPASLELPARASTGPALRPSAATATLASGPGSRTAAAGTVLAIERLGADLLRFALARPAGFDYRPGQSVKLELGGLRRRYTMVSAPHEPHLEFFVELVPGGRMSARLLALRRNDRVGIGGSPKAGIALETKARRHLMLATVTGVNPFVSILRDARHCGARDLQAILVQGASFADEFGYRAELEGLAVARPDLLAYFPTISRPGEARNAGWAGATGRADARIDETVARFRLRPADTAVYACGNPGMVDTARQRLTERGFAVRTERYT